MAVVPDLSRSSSASVPPFSAIRPLGQRVGRQFRSNIGLHAASLLDCSSAIAAVCARAIEQPVINTNVHAPNVSASVQRFSPVSPPAYHLTFFLVVSGIGLKGHSTPSAESSTIDPQIRDISRGYCHELYA